MVEGFGRSIKYAMFITNGLIFIGGLVVFAIGVWTLADRSFMDRLLGSRLYIASAAILIATGIIIAVISFMGSIGSYKESRCMLLIFFVILFLMFLFMLCATIFGYIYRDQADYRMKVEMTTTTGLYNNDTVVRDAWDAVQKNFRCCGVAANGRQSWEIWNNQVNQVKFGSGNQVNQVNRLRVRVPKSCCRQPNNANSLATCQAQPESVAHTYHDDCYTTMKEFVKRHAYLIGGIGVGIACFLIIGMILSCALFTMIN